MYFMHRPFYAQQFLLCVNVAKLQIELQIEIKECESKTSEWFQTNK